MQNHSGVIGATRRVHLYERARAVLTYVAAGVAIGAIAAPALAGGGIGDPPLLRRPCQGACLGTTIGCATSDLTACCCTTGATTTCSCKTLTDCKNPPPGTSCTSSDQQ